MLGVLEFSEQIERSTNRHATDINLLIRSFSDKFMCSDADACFSLDHNSMSETNAPFPLQQEMLKKISKHLLERIEQSAVSEQLISQDEKINSFIEVVYQYAKANLARPGVRTVFKQMNEWLREGDFKSCDLVLASICVERLSVDLALSFLTITTAASRHLAKRMEFYNRTFQHVSRVRGKNVAKQLLGNLA